MELKELGIKLPVNIITTFIDEDNGFVDIIDANGQFVTGGISSMEKAIELCRLINSEQNRTEHTVNKMVSNELFQPKIIEILKRQLPIIRLVQKKKGGDFYAGEEILEAHGLEEAINEVISIYEQGCLKSDIGSLLYNKRTMTGLKVIDYIQILYNVEKGITERFLCTKYLVLPEENENAKKTMKNIVEALHEINCLYHLIQ